MGSAQYNPSGGGGTGAPTDATYLTQVASGSLSAEQAMGALATGLVKNTTTTGVQSVAAEGTDYGVGCFRDLYIARLRTACGLTAGTSAEFWQDFGQNGSLPAGWVSGLAGSGAQTVQVAATKGGIWRLDSGATGSSVANEEGKGGMIANVATDRWGIAARFAISTAIDAQAKAVIGLLNIALNKTVEFGFIGALDAANFILQYDGLHATSFVSLGVPADTNYHIVEVWSVGDSKLHARIDGAADVGPVTMSAAPADAVEAWAHVANGTTAASRKLDIDWVLYVTPRM